MNTETSGYGMILNNGYCNDNYITQQFIGLFDKKCKEIYEEILV